LVEEIIEGASKILELLKQIKRDLRISAAGRVNTPALDD
jgi:hypothetical protein